MEDWLPRHRITVHEYYRMGELGLFAPEARTELIEGEIIDVAPPGSRHSSVVAYLHKVVLRAVDDAAIVLGQSPVRLSDTDYADISSTKAPGTVSIPGLPGISVDLSDILT